MYCTLVTWSVGLIVIKWWLHIRDTYIQYLHTYEGYFSQRGFGSALASSMVKLSFTKARLLKLGFTNGPFVKLVKLNGRHSRNLTRSNRIDGASSQGRTDTPDLTPPERTEGAGGGGGEGRLKPATSVTRERAIDEEASV